MLEQVATFKIILNTGGKKWKPWSSRLANEPTGDATDLNFVLDVVPDPEHDDSEDGLRQTGRERDK